MADTDEKYMREAVRQAKKAYAIGEVPIGCVIVYQDKIIGRGYNRRTVDKNTLAHAELIAIRKASRKMGDWRLEGCTMYVTLEPCQMCSGAIVQSRMERVVIGCMNPKAGCAGSILNLLQMEEFNHRVDITTEVLGEECSQMMKGFFRELREKKKKGLTGSIPRFISLFIRALRFERDFTDVTLAAARSRRPYGTRKVLLSAASFPT